MATGVRNHLATFFCALGLVASLAIPASAGAESPISLPGMEIVFAGEGAKSDGDLVAVPVTCLGGKDEFCSGTVTLSRGGHSASIPVSIEGGASESVYVALRLGTAGSRPIKVRGVATTAQRLGSPSSTETFLYAH
jgi:hypothetical protein